MKSFHPKKILTYLIPLCSIAASGLAQAGTKVDPFEAQNNKKEILTRVSAIQIPFLENKGQVKNGAVRYYAKTMGGTIYVTREGELVYSLPKAEEGKPTKGWSIKERFVGSKIARVTGEEKAITKMSYFRGKDPEKWKNNVPTYDLVSLGEVYKGIEVTLKAHGNNVEKLFLVKPGADPGNIKVNIEGAKALEVNDAGELEVSTDIGAVRFTMPVAFQEEDGRKKNVKVSYLLNDDGYGFMVGGYDHTKELVIDPLLASTFLGGSGYDIAHSLAIDSNGNIFVAGHTESSDFPITPGSFDTTLNSADIFISKFTGDLTTLLASTFLGGGHPESPDNDYAYLLSIASDDSLYVAGSTNSPDFPVTPGAYDTSYNGSDDGFIANLSNDLSALLTSTYLGGSGYEWIFAMILDTDDNVYVTGYPASSDFPTTPGAYDTSQNGYYDVFISKFNSNLTTILASTFLGGTYDDSAVTIDIDSDGKIYVGGYTVSSDFPTTPGAFDTTYSSLSGGNGFISKFSNDLTALVASTFLGGIEGDRIYSLAIRPDASVYVAGVATSPDFPATPGAYDTAHNGGWEDGFVSKLSGDLTTLVASTFVGGSGSDLIGINSIAVDALGNVFLSGRTDSSDFPTTPGAYDISYDGSGWDNGDGFITKFTSDLTSLVASTFLGGVGDDNAIPILIRSDGNVYVAGGSSSADFPITDSAYDTSHNGFIDTFIAKLDNNLSASIPIPDIKANGSDGPLTISNSADDLIITVSLDPGGYQGRNVDWWARGLAPNGDKYWYVYKTGQWVKSPTPIRARGGTCKAVLPMEILNRSTMPVGTWVLHFGVDAGMNNVLDMGLLHWDKVKVMVNP